MFSTNDGEAFPVRTPENSCCTTSSVLIIFSSASSKISSSAIIIILLSQFGSACDQCANFFAGHNPRQVLRSGQVKHDDRHFVVHAERKSGRIHHFELLLQCF